MDLTDFGATLSVQKLQEALLALQPCLSYDPAGRLGFVHPHAAAWQGVYWNERHVASMDRGPIIPEFDVWSVLVMPSGEKRRHRILRIGWRTTVQMMVQCDVPGITWSRVSQKLDVPMKQYIGPLIDIVSHWSAEVN